jgi:hypothetical protein
VLHASSDTIEHPAWRQFESGSINAEELGQIYANMWRAINEAQQVQLLQPTRCRESAEGVVAMYYEQLAAEYAADPQCMSAVSNSLLLQRQE